jgi:hypothetical protein
MLLTAQNIKHSGMNKERKDSGHTEALVCSNGGKPQKTCQGSRFLTKTSYSNTIIYFYGIN